TPMSETISAASRWRMGTKRRKVSRLLFTMGNLAVHCSPHALLEPSSTRSPVHDPKSRSARTRGVKPRCSASVKPRARRCSKAPSVSARTRPHASRRRDVFTVASRRPAPEECSTSSFRTRLEHSRFREQGEEHVEAHFAVLFLRKLESDER